MKQKRALLILLAVSCLLTVAGCKDRDSTNDPNSNTQENTVSTASTNTGNPFKEYKDDKNSALFSKWFYLNERGITLFNEYRLEYLKTMTGDNKKNLKRIPITKTKDLAFKVDSNNQAPTLEFEGTLENDLPSGYGDIYENGKKILSAHFTKGEADSYIIFYKDDGSIMEGDLSKIDKHNRVLESKPYLINDKIEYIPRIYYFNNKTVIINTDQEVELDNTNTIIYTVSFKDGSAIEKFYDKNGVIIAKLESKDHNFFDQINNTPTLTEYFTNGKVKYQGTGLTQLTNSGEKIFLRDGLGKEFDENGNVIYDGMWNKNQKS